jgi:hypothetical protein
MNEAEEFLNRKYHPFEPNPVIDKDEVIILLDEYAQQRERETAINFLNYLSCIEDFTDPRGLDKENTRIYDEWYTNRQNQEDETNM